MATNSLIRAAIAGNSAKIETLLARDDIRELAEQHVSNKNTQTALIIAASNGDAACVQLLMPVSYLLQTGKDSASDPWEPPANALRAAVISGHADCARMLAGPTGPQMDVDDARALLHVAMRHESAACLQALLDTPACAAAANTPRRGEPKEAVLSRAMKNVAHLRAIAPHCDLNAVDGAGKTALRHAIEADRVGAERVRILIAAGASPSGAIEQRSDYDKSPLRFAATTGHAAAVGAMLAASEPQAIHSAVAATLSRLREIGDPVADSAIVGPGRRWSRGHAQALDMMCAIDLRSDHLSDHFAEMRSEALSRLGAGNLPKTYALVEAREIAQALQDAQPRVDLAAAHSNTPGPTAKDESGAVSASGAVAQATPSLRRASVASGPRRM